MSGKLSRVRCDDVQRLLLWRGLRDGDAGHCVRNPWRGMRRLHFVGAGLRGPGLRGLEPVGSVRGVASGTGMRCDAVGTRCLLTAL